MSEPYLLPSLSSVAPKPENQVNDQQTTLLKLFPWLFEQQRSSLPGQVVLHVKEHLVFACWESRKEDT
jgi:hypothetical protein